LQNVPELRRTQIRRPKRIKVSSKPLLCKLSTRDVDEFNRLLGFEFVGDLPKVMRGVVAAR
jgi:hypothetical protein